MGQGNCGHISAPRGHVRASLCSFQVSSETKPPQPQDLGHNGELAGAPVGRAEAKPGRSASVVTPATGGAEIRPVREGQGRVTFTCSRD